MRPEEQAVSRAEWRDQAEYRREPEGQAVSRAECRRKPEAGGYLVRQEGQAASRGEYRGRAVCLERRREDLGNVRRKAA